MMPDCLNDIFQAIRDHFLDFQGCNMKISKTLRTASVWAGLVSALILTSCGGGSASGDEAPAVVAPTISSGKFIDSAVEGLTYVSGSTTGTTSSDGTFQYENGATVTFKIGDIVLGTVTPKSVLTPVDLVSGAKDETDPTVTNIAKFLQTLDDDNSPTAKITISTAAANAAKGQSVNFAQSVADFEADAGVQAAVSAITGATTAGTRTLVSTAAAQSHLRANLIERMVGTYTGSYSGDSSGTFTVSVESGGTVAGSGVEGGFTFGISGAISSDGTGAFGVAGASTFTAKIDPDTGALSGTWTWISASGGGTFSGTRK